MDPLPLFFRSCRRGLLLGSIALGVSLAGCSGEGSGPVVVSVVGSHDDFAKPLQNLPNPAAKLMLESTAQGLVAFDAGGDIVPALAQRWIVEDEGRSYIFRLRRAFWADGTRVTAPDVARILMARIVSLRRLDPDGPLDAVQTVVPMTGEVIEIRLGAARPFVLQMLAQPQMGLLSREGGTGPYRRAQQGKTLLLTPIDRLSGDDESAEGPVPRSQLRVLRSERAALAIIRFRGGQAALILGGRFTDLPLLVPAGIDRDAVRVDPVQGLFGLAVVGDGKLLDDADARAAINMAIDRSQLPAIFPLGGWATTEQIVPSQIDLGRAPTPPAWANLSMEDRRTQAGATIAHWRAENGAPPILRIALPAGPGATLLFGMVRRNLAAVGLDTRRVDMRDEADLRLVDEVAPYDSAFWYLGRVGCARKIRCSAAADAQLQAASLASSADERAARIAQAEALVQGYNGYIALGAPVRWSLASKRLTGFTPSPRARHPLNHLFRRPN
ncbi:ABC transporter substrate-binding protein [Sphingobium sp. BYY-5]|uniref:ABC transporter substrate-binding protein n=1 Tax=Sphingobium sp. BYY-5 TaxID=2926400 RepID=UPI001FA7A455|nr:ABC transporter substrate-binding protein [Sphingobium sp. BYY-5]MCI4588507.1 ABC transporter substrate-binding protein [Sphingobium sp. BYY-5]